MYALGGSGDAGKLRYLNSALSGENHTRRGGKSGVFLPYGRWEEAVGYNVCLKCSHVGYAVGRRPSRHTVCTSRSFYGWPVASNCELYCRHQWRRGDRNTKEPNAHMYATAIGHQLASNVVHQPDDRSVFEILLRPDRIDPRGCFKQWREIMMKSKLDSLRC